MMTRKQFLGTLFRGTAVAAGGATLLSGCSDDGGGTPSDAPSGTGNCNANGTTVAIGTDHGHSLVVTKADIAAAASKTYDIRGSSGHTHSVTLTMAHFQALAANQIVMVQSTPGGIDSHTHSVRVSCA
jgi:hypothetical protein